MCKSSQTQKCSGCQLYASVASCGQRTRPLSGHSAADAQPGHGGAAGPARSIPAAPGGAPSSSHRRPARRLRGSGQAVQGELLALHHGHGAGRQDHLLRRLVHQHPLHGGPGQHLGKLLGALGRPAREARADSPPTVPDSTASASSVTMLPGKNRGAGSRMVRGVQSNRRYVENGRTSTRSSSTPSSSITPRICAHSSGKSLVVRNPLRPAARDGRATAGSSTTVPAATSARAHRSAPAVRAGRRAATRTRSRPPAPTA